MNQYQLNAENGANLNKILPVDERGISIVNRLVFPSINLLSAYIIIYYNM